MLRVSSLRVLVRTAAFCTSTRDSRVLCSVRDLLADEKQALKFEVASGGKHTRTAFVFWANDKPRAFLNQCPHANLELDMDDSEFFSDNFIQCKAHGAFFDPSSGICLQGPASVRSDRQRCVQALRPLDVVVEDGNVILRSTTPMERQTVSDTYKVEKQKELAAVMSERVDDVAEMERRLHEKAQARIQKYKQQDQL